MKRNYIVSPVKERLMSLTLQK